MRKMLSTILSINARVAFACIAVMIGSPDLNVRAHDTNTVFKIKSEDVLSSVHVKWFQVDDANRTAFAYSGERGLLITNLLQVFENPQTPNRDLCTCAYYFGEMRASEAAEALASSITLELDYSHIITQGIYPMAYDPAMNALIKIGMPSVPAVMRNLAESDDAKVRVFSLKTLVQIEGEKDVVNLRLQKAWAAQGDAKKKDRIQAAMKALKEMLPMK